MDNPHVIGMLVQCGATNVESCIGIAKTNEKHNALSVLLLILAAQTGNLDKSVLQKVCEKQDSISTIVIRDTETRKKIMTNDFQRNYFMYSMATPLEIARHSGHTSVRDKLLFVLGVFDTSGYVYWHGLQLQQLEIEWLRKIAWVKDFTLSRNGLKSLYLYK